MSTEPPAAPTFVLAGAAKSGTSTLAALLATHPQVHMCPRKESHHYLFRDVGPPRFAGPGDGTLARMVVSDPDEWQRLMADAARSGARAVGESAVYYLYRPEVWPALAGALGPEGKVVLILRDPVYRVVSAWGHLVRDGRETLDLAQALDAEDDRVAAGWEWSWHLTRVSRYSDQLPAVYDWFDPTRVFVADFAELRSDPAALLSRVHRFLAVDDHPPVTRDEAVPVHNPSGQVRSRRLHRILTEPHPLKDLLRPLVPNRLIQSSYRQALSRNLRPLPEVPPEVRARLTATLADQPPKVVALTGLDTSAWCRPE